MTANKVIIQAIKDSHDVLGHVVFGNGESLTFRVETHTFTLVTEGDEGFRIYMSYQSSGGWQLLPGGKSGKTMAVINKFIAERTKPKALPTTRYVNPTYQRGKRITLNLN